MAASADLGVGEGHGAGAPLGACAPFRQQRAGKSRQYCYPHAFLCNCMVTVNTSLLPLLAHVPRVMQALDFSSRH